MKTLDQLIAEAKAELRDNTLLVPWLEFNMKKAYELGIEKQMEHSIKHLDSLLRLAGGCKACKDPTKIGHTCC